MSYPRLNGIYNEKGVNLADGGLGLTLETKFGLKIAHTPLWSTRAAVDDVGQGSQALLQAHMEFLRAGARTLLTATYQAAYNTFEREGYTRDRALKLMSNAVTIANKARSQYQVENPDIQTHDIRIVLSLCAFGGTVSPMQDYDGIYPPPYGPRAYTTSRENITSFGEDLTGREKSVQALEEFHVERVLAFAENGQIWDTIDAIAFETLSLAREVTAIRRAMTTVEEVLRKGGKCTKPWWITAVFPDGRCRETRVPGGDSIPAKDVATAMIQEETNDQGMQLAKPDGIGINCTEVQLLPELLEAFAQATGSCVQGSKWPWFILKPNGIAREAETWAAGLLECIDKMEGGGWEGIVVGGCCAATPDFIDSLRIQLMQMK
ncbi:Homocysteine S-methyltransferase [Pisolithus croceorrhizus]|nr:Homocysteine S-methyltransferase [Pisolithus croceorrhizus]